MRIRTLELEKFGAFDALRLRFRSDARVHVVYGPNEAGKSTALAAVGALLYGVPDRTPYAFRYPAQDLRIGAELVGRDGSLLAVRRRKGRRNTLVDEAGAPLPDEALDALLGGVGEDAFRRSFGLDAAALREGGKAMLGADGDVGATLLEAASGLRGLLGLRARIEDEADAIFGERKAAHRLFYQALDRHGEAVKAIKARELKVDEWRRLNDDIAALGARVEAIRAGRREGDVERARLARHKRAAPALKEIAALKGQIDGYADLPRFAPGQADAIDSALKEKREAGEAVGRALADEQRRRDEAERIACDSATLAEAHAIESLFQTSGAYAKERQDLPRVQAEAAGFAAEIANAARALGLMDADALEARRPTEATMADLRALLVEGRRLQAEGEAQAALLASQRKEVEALRTERERRPPVFDPTAAREAYLALGKVAERARKADKDGVDLADETRRLGEALARLDPLVADLDALAARPLPREADVARFEHAFDASLKEALSAAQNRKAVETDMAATTARLATLAAGRPLATESRIASARAARGEAWHPLRAALLTAEDAPPAKALPALTLEFEHLAVEADRLADNALSDAARLAEHQLETQRLDAQTRAYALAQAGEARAAAGRSEIEREWTALWEGVAERPRAPAQMRDWIGRVADAFAVGDRLHARRAALDAERGQLAALRPTLRKLAGDLGLTPMEGLDIAMDADRIERRLDEAANAFRASRDVEARYVQACLAAEEAARAETEAARRLGAWRDRADAALPSAGVEAGASIEAAEAALDVWVRALSDEGNYRNRALRVAGMRRNMEAFEAEASALVARCAPEAANLPADAAARVLNDRLAAARRAETQRAEAVRSLDTARRVLGEARERLIRAEAALAAAEPLGAEGDLPVLIARERERATLSERLREERRHLLDLADGADEERLSEEMAGFDPDAAAARLAELERENEARGSQENEAYAARVGLLGKRAELEEGVGAEEAWQQRRNAEAELVEAARRWAVLKAASALIGSAIDRHRASRRDPLMTRAGEIFALVTGGAFSGLDQKFGEDDEPELVGLRRSGEAVHVKALSEGTRDQLYLALRLAVIEAHAARSEAPPFVGDDIFASFDDARTAAGLAALAAVGERVQTILFTHHRHVADAAKARLGAKADIVEII